MTTIEAEVVRRAVLAAQRARVWEELSDVSRLDRLMPAVHRYDPVGHGWRWELEARGIMGYRIQPRFTVTYDLTPPERLAFRHVAGERGDTAGSHGAFMLREVDNGTEVAFDLAVIVDLDVPSLFRTGVREILRDEVRRMADGFLGNLRAAVGS